jgi:hypothetical protein
MLLLLMMQLEKLGFIAFDKNLMFLIIFKKWKALVENETRKSLKCLRSDNGGEYCGKEFDDYCSYHGFVERRQFDEHHKKMVCQKG